MMIIVSSNFGSFSTCTVVLHSSESKLDDVLVQHSFKIES